MPAIRDYSWANETVTTDGGITIPMCNYQAGDLLLVFAMGDTGAPTWGCSGYTQLFARNNTCSTVCFWKIAGASEGDVVVTASVSETYNGVVIAIRDVDTTNPFGNPAVRSDTTQAAAARYAMPQITTNVADAMIIFFGANSGVGVPSFIEGPVTGLLGADGAAESMGVGWMMQRATGLSSADIFCSNIGTGAGVKAAIQIAPPSGGATVIPAYCAADLSTHLEFLNGTTGYNGNTGMAATADTNFGTSLGGITANDATVAASADVGINSFHSFARLTNAAAAGTVSGAELVFSAGNRPNVGVKNILCHVRPQTPGNYQRLAPVSSGRGVWMGMRSAAANYKIWQVHGVGTKWSQDSKIPIVINSSAVNTKATAGTLDTAAIQAFGFWTSGIGILTAGVEFGMLWLMDTTTVCGGNASEPIDISGIVRAAAQGHERMSCIQQGSRQMLCLQDIQIGDGGTNSVYLDLDGTAIEFPRQYNAATSEVNYNSVDNKVGIKYFPGASDTIKHRNSVISSPSRYFWGLHASASTSASYDFSGLSVIGAGTITLNRAVTISELTISNYVSIDATGLTLLSSIIKGAPTTNDSLVVGTLFDKCSIDCSGVASGNRLCSVASPSVFTNCQFIGGGGHAIRITTPGTYSFTGNTFTGFGADGSNGAAIYNDSGGAVTLNITGGGGTPTVRNGAGASTTINNQRTVTLTGLKNPTEVRVYLAGTATAVAGQEEVTTGSFAFSIGSGVAIDISILALGYQNMRILNYSTTTDASVPISQQLDRQYLNP